MTTQLKPGLLRKVSLFVAVTGLFSIAVGVVGLAGWVFQIEIMKAVFPGLVTMKANTAVCFVLIGLSLWWLRAHDRTASVSNWIAKAAAVIVSGVGLLSFLEFLGGWNFGIDQLFFVETAEGAIGSVRPGLMSPITALTFVLLGLALLLLDWTGGRKASSAQSLAFGSGLISLFALLDFIVQPHGSHMGMALHTAIALCLLSFGVVCSRPERGFVGTLLNPDYRSALPENALRRWASVGPLLAVFLIGFMTFLTGQSNHWAEVDADWVAHTHVVQATLQAAVAHAVDMETGARGFAATGQEAFLEPYRDGQRAVAQDLDALRHLTADSAVQQKRLDRLRTQVDASMESNRKIADRGQRTGAVPADTEFIEGKRRMDAVRATVAEMQGEEAKLLDARLGRTQKERRLREIIASSGAFVGIALLVLAGLIVRREISHGTRMREQLRTLNGDLERRSAENRQAAEEARKSSLYARSLLEASLDPLVTISREGKITDVNEATEKITGVSRENLIGSDFSNYFTDPESARRGYEQVFAQGAVQDYPLAIRSTAGKITDVLYNATVFKNEAGEVEGVFAAARDVTDRKRAQEIRERLAAIVYSSDDAIISKTLEGTITAWNHGAEKVFGYASSEAVGKPMLAFIPADRVNEESDILACIRRGESVEHFETIRVRKDGRRIDVSLTISPIKDSSGVIVGASKIARDITERKRAERVLRSLSDCNEALVRTTDEPSLLHRICDLVVTAGGYRMAWVGYAEHDEKKTVRVVAESGFEAGYLDTTNITWADTERGRGPTGTAIRTGKPAVCHDVTSDPRFAPWREHALQRGYRSTLVLPLKNGGEAFGAISIYATEAGAFDSREQHLLEELSNNLSYGIAALRTREERRRAEEEIRRVNQELEERVRQRTAQLHESEQRVRRKLDSILSPEGDLGNLELADILDIPAIQSLLNDFYSVVHVTTALIDLQGKVLAVVGWQNICMQFHRKHPETCKNCIESDMQLSAGVPEGEFKIYKCKNNMWDVATPIMLGGQHLGNLFCGQFFFEDEPIDYEVFRSQARQYGFNEDDYIAALDVVPRLSRAAVNASMTFLAKLAGMISQLSYSGIKLARSMTETGRVNAELTASVKELEAFTYSVSHDLRAPLRHISGFSKMLTEEFGPNLPTDAQHHLQRIQEGTRRMGLLVDDLLNLARVGRCDVSLRVSGLKSVVDEVLADLAPECADRKIEWKIGNLPFVECDPALMKQVFQNLLSNAVKFTRPRSPAVIEVGQKDQEGTPVVFVRDNGVGFNIKYADKLFGVFQRLHRPEDFEGTGVGLATVQRIIQKHGGRIWAEAELDKGATFYFTLAASEKTELKTKAAIVGDKA